MTDARCCAGESWRGRLSRGRPGSGAAREGFDFARHPLSVLANGSWGWVQTANFVLSGLMVLAATVGFGRVLGPKITRAFRWTLAVATASEMLLAAIFPADPIDGFPPGTPKGMPASISTTGLMHFVAGALTFLMLGLSGLRGRMDHDAPAPDAARVAVTLQRPLRLHRLLRRHRLADRRRRHLVRRRHRLALARRHVAPAPASAFGLMTPACAQVASRLALKA